ncbi:unnamed protein product [Victoria cruziana]
MARDRPFTANLGLGAKSGRRKARNRQRGTAHPLAEHGWEGEHPGNFKHFLTLFSKSFSSFPRGSGHDGALTLSGALFQGTWAQSVAEDASTDYNSEGKAHRFSFWAIPGSLAVTKGILVSFFSSAY